MARRTRGSFTDGLAGSGDAVRLDISSLVDVVFLLLLFFIVSSRIATEEILKIELPQAGSGTAGGEPPLEINLTAGGQVFFGNEPSSLENLPAQLQALFAASPEQGLTVRADGEVQHSQVIQVYDEAKKAGFRRLNIAVKRGQ